VIRSLIALLTGGSTRVTAETALSPAAQAVVDRMKALALPCAQLIHAAAPGVTRLGGIPDMPASLEWPRWKDRPLAFLAQIDLGTIAAAGAPDWLPAQGMLFFFYDSEQSTWGFDPTDRDSWAVLYAPAGRADRAAIEPDDLDPEARFPEVVLDAARGLSLPDPGRFGIEWSDLAEPDWEAVDALRNGLGPAYQIGGYARAVQNDDMERKAQLASNGLYLGNADAYESDRARAIDAGKDDWRLLLQLDSDDEADMMWGDAGMLYFWIREQDARARDFSNVWMILQCY
jgi:uncharacterized protein YwqG